MPAEAVQSLLHAVALAPRASQMRGLHLRWPCATLASLLAPKLPYAVS
jgi:hypothetical protein